MKLPVRLAGGLIYPLQEQALRRPTFSYLDSLEASQWLTRQAVESLQIEKLHQLLQLAYAHTPWHRRHMDEAGLLPEQLGSLSDLRKLPRMNKQDAAAHRDQLVWRDVPGGAFKYNTGGSSGEPLVFYMGLLGLPTICARLIEHGMDPETPVALVQQGTMPQQRLLVSTLRAMPEVLRGTDIHGPTITIVGQVVSLHARLQWFGHDQTKNDKQH